MDRSPAKDNPSVSVVMCTYNGAKYLEEQLQSILRQTYPLKEILIFDDGSTDTTVAILKRYAAMHPVMKVHVNATNLGYNRNFEKAVMAATGDLIAISDQDDVWMPEKTERMVQVWKPDTPLIYCTSVIFQQELTEKPLPWILIRPFEGKDGRRLFLNNTISGHALMFRKNFLKLALPFPENVMYDWWLAVNAAYNGGVQYLGETLVYQRKHQQNVTLTKEQYTLEQLKRKNKEETIRNNYAFARIPAMPENHRHMAARLAKLMEESLEQAFNLPLFLFLFRRRRLLFDYVGHEPLLYYQLKHSYRKASRKVRRSI